MNIYFTSDNHWNHFNIIRYCNRPFTSLQEMDLVMIRKWNEKVSKEDLVFHLGDFCFSKSSEAPDALKDPFTYYRSQLNGNIVFIKGNHDHNNKNKTIIESLIINYGGKRIFLTHNPEFCNVNFDINFTGHVHEKWQFKRYRKGEVFTDCCNVGVDVWDFYPVTINQLMSRYCKWKREINE